ncbi:MAG: sulfite exporter TauE/SafE family protein [Bacteroidetes bacterium]|nr:MAG: sulfite exporter TauE/SafE family protein [Bacteroidota bacterium]
MIFLTGLLSSLHCIGMCGFIVLAYSTPAASSAIQEQPTSSTLLHVAYNVGRILSYTVLGAAVGIVGMTIGWMKGIGEYFSIISGIIMLLSGVALLGIIPLSPTISLFSSNGIVTRIQSKLLQKRTIRSKLAIGLLAPLLPCGILYSMFAKAAATGDVFQGALTMGFFALGMTPALMTLGSFSSFFSARVRKGAEQIAAIMIILMGIALILRGFHVPYLSWLSSEPTCPHCAS